MNSLRRICIFCGSSPGTRPEYAGAARAMGTALLRRGLGLVYGGGDVGLMGAVSSVVLAGGGEVIGVIPDFMLAFEPHTDRLTRLIVISSMHARKSRMAELGDAFIALPGGFGTMEELFEVITHAQVGQHQKPVGLLNVAGYFDPLLAFIDHAAEEGFLYADHRSLVNACDDPNQLIDLLFAYRPPEGLERWMDPNNH